MPSGCSGHSSSNRQTSRPFCLPWETCPGLKGWRANSRRLSTSRKRCAMSGRKRSRGTARRRPRTVSSPRALTDDAASWRAESQGAPIGFIAKAGRCRLVVMHRRSPPKSTIEDIPRPILPEPNADFKSSAPPVVVECWCGLVAHMDREHLDRFTRSTWRRFDERDLSPAEGGDSAAPRGARVRASRISR